MNESGFVSALLLFEAQHCQNASCTSGSPPQPKGSNLLFAEYRTQIVCLPSCMQSPPGHTLYFAADPTRIICIYSRSVPPPSLSQFFPGICKKKTLLGFLHLWSSEWQNTVRCMTESKYSAATQDCFVYHVNRFSHIATVA